jgi:hypothetical protein
MITPTYDAHHNPTSAGDITYSYSAKNLLKAAIAAANATPHYNALG